MTRRRDRDTRWTSLVAGVAILACGVILWLDQTGRADAGDLLRWWPLALVAMGVAHLPQRQWVGALVWGGLGLWFLAPMLGYETFPFRRVIGLWPLLISYAGATVIMQALRPVPRGATNMHTVAVMGGNVRRIGAQPFAGGDAVAVMGGCEIDFGSAQLTGEATLDVMAFWGGIEVRVPAGWQVVGRVTPILGGYADKTAPAPDGAPRLIIRGSAIMGGVDVANVKERAA
jgi:hypothetical protein